MAPRRVLVLVVAFLLATTGVSAAAQTPASGEILAEDELAGIQATVLRSYAPVGTFVGEGVLTVDNATPVSSVEGTSRLRDISVVVREFDTTDNAALAFEQIRVGTETLLATVFPEDGTQEITSEELPGVGTQATLVRSDYAGPGSKVWIEYVTVHRDQYVFFVSATGSVFMSMPGSDNVDRSLPTK